MPGTLPRACHFEIDWDEKRKTIKIWSNSVQYRTVPVGARGIPLEGGHCDTFTSHLAGGQRIKAPGHWHPIRLGRGQLEQHRGVDQDPGEGGVVVNSTQPINKPPRVRHSELTTVSSSMVGHPDKDGQVHGPSLVLTAISESRIGEGLDVNPGTTVPCPSQQCLSLHSC